MAKIITENFRVETAKEIFSSFTSQNETIATNFLAGLDSYVANNNGVTLSTSQKGQIQDIVEVQLNENIPVSSYYIMGSSIDKASSIKNTISEQRDFKRRVIFGNKVTDENIRYMFYKNAWTTGTVYDDFDDTQDTSTLNSIVTVSNAELDYEVFKCIENNNGSPSTSSPTFNGIDATSYEQIYSADGYVWKYLFTVRRADDRVFGTDDSLPLPYPSYGDPKVIAAAKESISQIIIEDTVTNLFSGYRFGDPEIANDTSTVKLKGFTGTSTSNVKELTLEIIPKSGLTLDSGTDSYTNMYLVQTSKGDSVNTFNGVTVYDVLSSTTADNKTIKVLINSTISSFDAFDAFTFQLVPKIDVTQSTSTGTPSIAYGIIDQFGTLKRISFKSRGDEYKYATATLALPSGLSNLYTPDTAATLRCVISPPGGHGSDMISELSMSRLSVITNFSGDDIAIPNANTYTKVGLVKNPSFIDNTLPTGFDNRAVITIAGDQRSGAVAGKYVTQTVALDSSNSETIVARIHESVYSTTTTKTKIYLVDYTGNFKNKFQTGSIKVKDSLSDTSSTTLNINNASTDVTYGNYSPYSGKVLHFVDFDPIQRQAARKEKIKFIFDF